MEEGKPLRMKKLTFTLTLLAICGVIIMVFPLLFLPPVGLAFGVFFALPLAVTLILSKLLRGAATQTILLVSTVGYLAAFTYLIRPEISQENGSSFTVFLAAMPAMALLWLVAGFTSRPSLQKWEQRYLSLRQEHEEELAHFPVARVREALESQGWQQTDVFADGDFWVSRHVLAQEEIFLTEESSSAPKLAGTPAQINGVRGFLK